MAARSIKPKRAKFVDEYLIDLNITQAAVRCGYSKKTAGQQGHRLYRNVKIRAEIDRRMAARAQETGVTAQRVVQEAARLAFSDLREVAEWDRELGVRFKGSDEISDDAARSIQSVKSRTTRKVNDDDEEFETVELEIKLYPKDPSLTLLARHLGMLKDRVEHSGTVRLEDLLGAATRPPST